MRRALVAVSTLVLVLGLAVLGPAPFGPSTPAEAGVDRPGLLQPGVLQPGPVQPGPVQPGPVQPGPVQAALLQPGVAAPATIAAPGEPAEPVEPPPVTVNPFMPAERSLSECLSVVPKPGCGSEARGGPYQAAVFGAIVLGLGIIGTRIAIGVRRNRAAEPQGTR